MKKIFLAMALMGIVSLSASAAGETEVPAAVKSSFQKLYPKAEKVKWGKEDVNYEAEFKQNGTEMSCLFDKDGKLLETETEIEISALPKAVSDYVTKNYPNDKIREASKIVDAKNVVTYEAEVKEGDLVFDAQGNFIRKVVEKKDNDNDEKKEKK
ncbi:MAG TPA: PepSY-like domain-containing protein [Bacteroidia bacterium]